MAKNIGDFKEDSNVEIHGMLCEVSPMKKGKGTSYFDGKISDGRQKYAYLDLTITLESAWQKLVVVLLLLLIVKLKKATKEMIMR